MSQAIGGLQSHRKNQRLFEKMEDRKVTRTFQKNLFRGGLAAAFAVLSITQQKPVLAQQVEHPKVVVDWMKVTGESKTIPTTLVVQHPLLRQGNPLHETAMRQISELGPQECALLVMVYVPTLGCCGIGAARRQRKPPGISR